MSLCGPRLRTRPSARVSSNDAERPRGSGCCMQQCSGLANLRLNRRHGCLFLWPRTILPYWCRTCRAREVHSFRALFVGRTGHFESRVLRSAIHTSVMAIAPAHITHEGRLYMMAYLIQPMSNFHRRLTLLRESFLRPPRPRSQPISIRAA